MDDTPRKGGLHVASDDLTVGHYYAVSGCKCHDNPVPIGGIAFAITAIELPYIVGKMVPSGEVLTFDTRYLNFMRVSDEYVKAQAPAPPAQQGMMMVSPEQLLNMLRQRG